MFQRADKPTSLYAPQDVRSKIEPALSQGEDAARAAIRSDIILWRSAARDSHVIWGDALLSLPTEAYVQDEDIQLAYNWPELWGMTGNLRRSMAVAEKMGLPPFLGSKLERSMLTFVASGIAFRRRICETDQNLGLDDYQRSLVRITSANPSSEHYLSAIFGPLEAFVVAASDYYIMQTRLCEIYAAQNGTHIETEDIHDLRRQIVPRIVRAATGKNTDYHVGMMHFLRSDNAVRFERSSRGQLVVRFGDLPDHAEAFFRATMAKEDPDFLTFLDGSKVHTGCPMLQAKLDGKTFLTNVVNRLANAAEQDMANSPYAFGQAVRLQAVQPASDFMPK